MDYAAWLSAKVSRTSKASAKRAAKRQLANWAAELSYINTLPTRQMRTRQIDSSVKGNGWNINKNIVFLNWGMPHAIMSWREHYKLGTVIKCVFLQNYLSM